MTRQPFDPMKTAAMQAAKARKGPGLPGVSGPAKPNLSPDAPPLAPHEERALIESFAAAQFGIEAEAEAEELMTLPAGTATKPLTVRQLNALLNDLLANTLPPTFFIAGEISNFRTYDRGHAFFTLKEPGAEIPCILWKDGLARLKFKPKDGLAVIARGSVKLYEPQGKIQLYVETLLPQGAGALELAFRQLCEKLKAEGLFDQSRKRPLPKLPRTVAIITSKTGDVLHDVLTTAYRRFPGLHTLLFPVRVQGDQAAPEIVKAIHLLNAHNERFQTSVPSLNPQSSVLTTSIDLILLVRGGGSLEDLWAFNEESVARAIAASRIPIATGIGHEPDTTIADLVGDLRGPTPTGVTELTIPDVRTLLADIASKSALLTRDLRRLLEFARNRLDRSTLEFTTASREAIRNRDLRIDMLCRQIARIEPKHAIAQGWRRVEESHRNLDLAIKTRLRTQRDTVHHAATRLDHLSPVTRIQRLRDHLHHLHSRLHLAQTARLTTAAQKLAALSTQLRVVSPHSILDRGFSITTLNDGTILRSRSQVKKGDVIKTKLADGDIESTVGKPKQSSLF